MAGVEWHQADFATAWNAACRLGSFHYAKLKDETGCSDTAVRQYVKQWIQGGVVACTGLGPHRRKIFTVTKPHVQIPPRFNQHGVRVSDETVQGNLWRTMRGLPTFTIRDLAAHSHTDTCNVDERAAQDYCGMLLRAGYLKVLRKAIPEKRLAVYQLIRNTGPRALMERRVRAVYDGNVGKVVHVEVPR